MNTQSPATPSYLIRNIGRCPRCMKTSFLAASGSWVAWLGLTAQFPGNAFGPWMLFAPLFLSALWALHLLTYTIRVGSLLRREYLGDGPATTAIAMSDERRSVLWVLGTSVAIGLGGAIWLPSDARAASRCGEGRICPAAAPKCCSRSLGKCCNKGWSCISLGKCYDDHRSARAACGSGIVSPCN